MGENTDGKMDVHDKIITLLLAGGGNGFLGRCFYLGWFGLDEVKIIAKDNRQKLPPPLPKTAVGVTKNCRRRLWLPILLQSRYNG